MNLPENSDKTGQLPVIVIVGPTAVGKTAVSITLAGQLGAEIISADSRQIYKFLDIGTAKPSETERQGIAHHFIDYILPDEDFSSGAYGVKARELIVKRRAAGKNIIVVGGSGLYIRAMLYGMISFDQQDQHIRKELKIQLQERGLRELYRELRQADPALAAQLSKNDTQRILRGLEVFRMSGEKLSDLQQEKEAKAPFPFVQVGLTMERSKLYQRINDRVEQMVEKGLIDEVKSLLAKGFESCNAMNAVGYREVLQYLRQETSYQHMIESIQRNSRRYAKRQFTWFRKDKNIQWFEMPDDNIIDKVLSFVIDK